MLREESSLTSHDSDRDVNGAFVELAAANYIEGVRSDVKVLTELIIHVVF